MNNFAIFNSSFGFIKIEYEKNTLMLLKKLNDAPKDMGHKTEFTEKVFKELGIYFNGKRKK